MEQEWYIASLAIRTAIRLAAGSASGYLAAAAMALAVKAITRSVSGIVTLCRNGPESAVSATTAIESIGTIVIVNGVAQWFLGVVMYRSAFDGATIVVVAIVLAR